MSVGLEKILDRIREDPSRRVLHDRYLSLVADLQSSSDRLRGILELAKVYQNSDPRQTILLSNVVSQSDPTNIDALYLSATALQKIGKFDKAELVHHEIQEILQQRDRLSSVSSLKRTETLDAPDQGVAEVEFSGLSSAIPLRSNLKSKPKGIREDSLDERGDGRSQEKKSAEERGVADDSLSENPAGDGDDDSGLGRIGCFSAVDMELSEVFPERGSRVDNLVEKVGETTFIVQFDGIQKNLQLLKNPFLSDAGGTQDGREESEGAEPGERLQIPYICSSEEFSIVGSACDLNTSSTDFLADEAECLELREELPQAARVESELDIELGLIGSRQDVPATIPNFDLDPGHGLREDSPCRESNHQIPSAQHKKIIDVDIVSEWGSDRSRVDQGRERPNDVESKNQEQIITLVDPKLNQSSTGDLEGAFNLTVPARMPQPEYFYGRIFRDIAEAEQNILLKSSRTESFWSAPSVESNELAEALKTYLSQQQLSKNSWDIISGIYGVAPSFAGARLMEDLRMTRVSLGHWGVYLDCLIACGRLRKANLEILQTIPCQPSSTWVRAAWERLAVIWKLQGLTGFAWEETHGVKSFITLLKIRPIPALHNF